MSRSREVIEKLDERVFTLGGPITSAGASFLTEHEQSRTVQTLERSLNLLPLLTMQPGPVLKLGMTRAANDNSPIW